MFTRLPSRYRRLLHEETGAEVTELGIVLAMLVAGAVAVIVLLGPKVAAYYSSVNNQLP